MRARSIVSFLLALGVVAAQGCGQDFDPASRITSLRVLAVSADTRWAPGADATKAGQSQAYAQPGEKVWLKALWYAPPTVNARTWAWLRCVDPDSTSVTGCIEAIGKEVQRTQDSRAVLLNVPLQGVDQDVVSVDVPPDTISRLPDQAQGSAMVGVILIVCPGELQLLDLSAISKGQIPLQCLDNGGSTKQPLPYDEWVAGIKRIFVRDHDRNANPKIESVTWDGADWPSDAVKSITACGDTGNRYDRCTTDQHQVSVKVTDDSFEKGTDERGNAFTEQLVVEYYSTEGLFEHEVKVAADPQTGFAARDESKSADQPLTMWMVVHDNRGGVVWDVRHVQVK